LRFKALAPCARLIDQARCVAYSARTVKEAPQCELGPVEHPAVARVRIDAGLGRWVRGQQGCDLSWRAVASVHCCCRLGRRPLCMHLQESAAFTVDVGPFARPSSPSSGLVAAALGAALISAMIKAAPIAFVGALRGMMSTAFMPQPRHGRAHRGMLHMHAGLLLRLPDKLFQNKL